MFNWIKRLFNRPRVRINMEPRQMFGKVENNLCKCWCCGWAFHIEDRNEDYWTVTCPEHGCGATVYIWKVKVEEDLKIESK